MEESFAVFVGDNEQIYKLPLDTIGFDVSEGDICDAESDDGNLIILSKNEVVKAKRHDYINNLFDKLKRR
ncbi:MAG: hypothetical protein ACYC00_18670 [Eubacteriales bacterium]